MAITLTLTNYPNLGYITCASTNDLADYDHDDVAKIVLKRKFDGDNGGWITVYTKTVSADTNFTFSFNDKYCRCGKTYKYELDYYDSEGDFVVSTEETVLSTFDCIVLCDKEYIYTTPLNTGAINVNRIKPYIKYTPLNAYKPSYYCNTTIEYEEGNFQGTFLQTANDDGVTFTIANSWSYRDLVKGWLVNGKAKILKNLYGEAWIIAVKTDTIKDTSMVSNGEYEGARIISFEWFEIGTYTSEQDLYDLNLSNVTSAYFSGV